MEKKKKPTGEELLLKAQAMLKKAQSIKKAEQQAADVSLGQLLRKHLLKEITLEDLVRQGGKIIGLMPAAGGDGSES